MKKYFFTIPCLLFTLLIVFFNPRIVLAEDLPPVITGVSPASANYGDVVAISGSNFLNPNTDVATLKVYLAMSGGGTYLLASVTPNVNNTTWNNSGIQFKVTDNIARSGVVTVTVNNKLTNWQTFYMNSSQATSTPTPVPTSPPFATQGSTPTKTPTPQPNATSINTSTPKLTYSPKTTTPRPTIKPTIRPTPHPQETAEVTPAPNYIPTQEHKNSSFLGFLFESVISFFNNISLKIASLFVH